MWIGRPPFRAGNEYLTFKAISKGALPELPSSIPASAAQLIEAVLVRDPRRRLCGLPAWKDHAFFEGVLWEKWEEWVPPPLVPGSAPEDAEPRIAGVENVLVDGVHGLKLNDKESERRPVSECQRDAQLAEQKRTSEWYIFIPSSFRRS